MRRPRLPFWIALLLIVSLPHPAGIARLSNYELDFEQISQAGQEIMDRFDAAMPRARELVHDPKKVN